MKAKRRIAITGIGLVTPAGNTVDDTWRTLLAGRSCIGPITHFDAAGFPTRIAAEVRGVDAAATGSAINRRMTPRLTTASTRARGKRSR